MFFVTISHFQRLQNAVMTISSPKFSQPIVKMGGFACLLVFVTNLASCDKVSQTINRIRYPASVAQASQANENQQADPSQTSDANTQPVSYPFSQWQQQPIDRQLQPSAKMVDVIKAFLQQNLAKVGGLPSPKLDPKSLDYQGSIATSYHFTADNAPQFVLIDSAKYLELDWYFATPSDMAKEKQLAVTYASYAYQLARARLGNAEGDKLMQQILAGDSVKNQTINGVTVALAKCDNSNCQIVIKK